MAVAKKLAKKAFNEIKDAVKDTVKDELKDELKSLIKDKHLKTSEDTDSKLKEFKDYVSGMLKSTTCNHNRLVVAIGKAGSISFIRCHDCGKAFDIGGYYKLERKTKKFYQGIKKQIEKNGKF